MVNRTRLNLLAGLTLLVLATAFSPHAGAFFRRYWQNTHQRITTEALYESKNLLPFLEQVGMEDVELDADYVSLANRVDGVEISHPTSAAGVLVAGAVLEDGVEHDGGHALAGTFGYTRPLNHFENKLGLALTVAPTGWPASKWGKDVSSNEFSWKVAQESYREALAGPTEDEREEALATMLIALGCNLHLLQDLFQPSHSRDDAHPGHAKPALDPFMGHSELEAHVGREFTPFTGPIPWASPSPKRLPDRDRYFRSAIEFSADNFFSDDTEFTEPMPALGPDVFLENQSVPCPPGTKLVTYARSYAQDPPGGADAHLARHDFATIPTGPLSEESNPALHWMLTDEPCAGTQRILDDNMSILIPQAISYSAGLIDHFFRGRMSFVLGPGGALVIENTSHEVSEAGSAIDVDFKQDPIQVPAEFVFFWEDDDGKRTEFTREKLPPGGIPHDESFTIGDFGGRIPSAALLDGSARIAVVLDRAHVGDDPSIVGGVFSWTTCSMICREEVVKLFGVGDATGDGLDDLVLWVENDESVGEKPLESVTLLSGADCSVVWTITGDETGDLYGARVVGVGDVTGDDNGDIVVQKSTDVKNDVHTLELRHGVSGALITPFNVVELGTMHPLGDVGGDGQLDFLIDGGSKVCVYKATGGLLHHLFGITPSETVAVGPDVDGDGGADLTVLGTGFSFRVVSTQSGAVLAQGVVQDAPEVLHLDDVNGDGFFDFADNYKATQTLVIRSGKNGNPLWTLAGQASDIDYAGDFDGDGLMDVSARMFVVETDPPGFSWKTSVFSPGEKKKILSIESEGLLSAGQPFRIGDLGDDGRDDLARPFKNEEIDQNCFQIIVGTKG